MITTTPFKKLAWVATVFAVAAVSLFPLTSEASLKCQEIPSQLSCGDSAPRTITYAPGMTTSVAAPTIDGFPGPCWTWNRMFQCVETDPTYSCNPTADFNQVKADCSLTAAQINSSMNVNGINYITDADYTYQCAYGAWTTNTSLPTNKECVELSSTTTDTNIVPANNDGTNPDGSVNLNSSVAQSQSRDDKYVCYAPPVTTCSDTCYTQSTDPATGLTTKTAVPCSSDAVSQCMTASNQCQGTVTTNPDGSTTTNLALGPDGRCIDTQQQEICQSGDIPRCLSGNENCTLTSTQPANIQENGFAMSQQQNYTCTNQTESCTQYANVSNCVHVGAWGWDQLSIQGQVGEGLGAYNQAMAQLQGIQQGQKQDDPYIFSGQDLRCHYAVGNFLNTFIMMAIAVAVIVATGGAGIGALAPELAMQGFAAGMSLTTMNAIMVGVAAMPGLIEDAPNSKALGSNCCTDYVIQGSDAWYKLGSCTGDEVKLSLAKQKGLTHYIGEYCSKHSGFPIPQCVEKTRTYCAFDDMLALVVNEQGRDQLDQIAAADPTTTTATAPVSFSLYDAPPSNPNPPKYTGYLNTGHWKKLVQQNNSQVWTWVYPAYCASQTQQNAAYNLYQSEVAAATDTKGIQPSQMTQQQALNLIISAGLVGEFQDCPTTPGTAAYLTCSLQDDSCDTTRLPDGPTQVGTDDISGGSVSTADVNWRIQQVSTFYMPGDYGVTTLMPTNSAFAAVSASVNEYITSVGSCHKADGSCLYYFAITDKQAANGLGAKKRATDNAQFPLYTWQTSASWPAVTYVGQDGSMDQNAYMADPNRGVGNPTTLSTQRFLFHPIYAIQPPTGNLYPKVLMEWATANTDPANPANDYTPLLVPTSLPPGTPGWYPYGDSTQHGKYFYLSGGCDANSHWCNYQIMVDLDIQRHPWGSPESPACWGFTLEQLAALDFDKMDLSKWINSLDLDTSSASLSSDAAKAMTDQAVSTAQAYYGATKTGTAINQPGAGTAAMVLSSDILPQISNPDFTAFQEQVAIPTNWPNYFDDQPNTNPVTNPMINWGDGTVEVMPKDPGGRAYVAAHDYGGDPVATYKITVTLDTAANGPQTLSSNVSVTPQEGDAKEPTTLDFSNAGTDSATQGQYNPAQTVNGMDQSESGLSTIAPAGSDNFARQGDTVTAPAAASGTQ